MAQPAHRSLYGALGAVCVALLVTAALPRDDRRALFDEGLAAPRFSVDAGGQVHLAPEADMIVRFTLDGSLPDAGCPVLHDGAVLTPPDPSRWIHLPSSVQWRHPVGTAPRALTVRARSFQGGRMGPVTTCTLPPASTHHLPVVALSLPPGALFDPDTGIYVVGHAVLRDEAEVRASYQRANKWWRYPGNFHGRGKAWERAAHWEFFPGPGAPSTLNGPVRLRINGNNTRGFAQHALRLLFEEPLDANDPFATISGSGHRALLLRASGNDQDRTFFRDGLQHRLCAELPFGTSAQRQCVVYINGAYWGVHNLRERLDAKELARRHGVKTKQITVLADDIELYDGREEEVQRFSRFLTMAERWEASGSAFVDSLDRRLDIDGFLSYMAAQVVLGNVDWPAQNVRWWRYTGAADTARGPRDGRWRYLMGDSDLGFGLTGGKGVDLFARLQENDAPTARLFRACLRSAALRERWQVILERTAHGPLSAERMVQEATRMRDEILAEMPRHIQRWRRPLSVDDWNAHVRDLMDFATHRTAIVLEQYQAHRNSPTR